MRTKRKERTRKRNRNKECGKEMYMGMQGDIREEMEKQT
jgi:hypothetical protein